MYLLDSALIFYLMSDEIRMFQEESLCVYIVFSYIMLIIIIIFVFSSNQDHLYKLKQSRQSIENRIKMILFQQKLKYL